MILTYRSNKTGNPTSKSRPFQRESSEPKPPKFVVGDELEYRVARLHVFMGYFVRRACPIYTVANLDQATDLDVFALRYEHPFRRDIVISECKSGETGPLDRIFWLSGVKHFVGAREALLVRRSTKWNIKDFAKHTGVQVIDLRKIEELEGNFKIGPNEWPGVSDRQFYELNVAAWNKTLLQSKAFWELYQTLISEVRFDEPFAAVNYLLFQLRRLTKQFEKLPADIFHRFLIAESITQLCVFLMRIAEAAFDLSATDREGYIAKGLTYGSLEPKFAERILNNAYTITRQAILHVTNQPIDVDRSFFQMPVPPGAEQVKSLVEEIIRSYPMSLSFPQVTDLLLGEVFVKRRRTGGWLKRIFPYGDIGTRVELTRLYLKRLVEADACPRVLLEELQVTGAENGGKRDREISTQPGQIEKGSQAFATSPDTKPSERGVDHPVGQVRVDSPQPGAVESTIQEAQQDKDVSKESTQLELKPQSDD